jgi:dihydropteroate synthase
MIRKLYYWKLPSGELQLGERTLLMGILNVTPDSFSDGGHFSDPDRAYARAMEMEEQGADIIDIGAESTRPESARISADEEWRRLLPVLKLLKDKLTVPLSLDTYKSEIAERALQYGVQIFNDPSGLTFDPALAKTATDANAGLILNHMRGLPETWAKLPAMSDAIGSVGKDLEATASRARRAGVDKSRIVVDPGIGFGKRKEQNSEILAQLGRLAELGFPILIGPSRKSFLAQASDGETVFATAAAVTASILNGAHIVRVHDVKEMRAVAQIADEIGRLSAPPANDDEEEHDRHAPRKRTEIRPFEEEDRHRPMRPPLARPALPPTPIQPAPAPATSAADPTPVPSPTAPSHDGLPPAKKEWKREDRPAARDQRDDRPKYGSGGDRPPVRRPMGDKPPYRNGSGDKPPYRGSSGDRPPYRAPSGDRPPYRAPGGDRPPYRGASGDKPTYRGSSGDRPPSRGGPGGDRPPYRGASGDRPPSRGPAGDKPPYRSGPSKGPWDRPRQDGPPRGPGAGRPPRRDDDAGPPRGRPPQGGPPKRPFRKRP